MTEDRLVLLFARHVSGEPEPGDMEELERWAAISEINRQFLTRFIQEGQLEKEIRLWKNIDPALGFEKWLMARRRVERRAVVLRWAIAAAILLTVSAVWLIRQPMESSKQRSMPALAENKVVPGRNTATLQLGNGQTILLDSVQNGELGRQGASRLVKTDSGSIRYLAGNGANAGTMTYNILTTPRSGQYQLLLPDGSRVWLNNVSRLKYPTSFEGNVREVEMSGEAYFEIAKNAAKPFVVKVRDEKVEVLGTSFNVMAYPEEGGTQTTLLTGAVSVRTGNGTAVRLKTDEQTQVKADGGIKIIEHVSGEDIVSWKDGFFYFGRVSFETMMRQLARWYDVDVVYEGKIPEMEFGGKLDRNLPLNELLKFLDTNHIHFRLDGRKLIVLPN